MRSLAWRNCGWAGGYLGNNIKKESVVTGTSMYGMSAGWQDLICPKDMEAGRPLMQPHKKQVKVQITDNE